jgi:hypothetical protein
MRAVVIAIDNTGKVAIEIKEIVRLWMSVLSDMAQLWSDACCCLTVKT